MSLPQQKEESKRRQERKIYTAKPDNPREGDFWVDTEHNVIRVYMIPLE